MLEMLRRSIGPLIQIEKEFAADLWPAHVDANQLELALLNLVVNARDAMPEGGRLTLNAQNATAVAIADDALDAGDYVRLAVADTGSGMDEATLVRATEPFFTTKGAGKGTGLGLSMVHGLAAQSGGALRLSSRPGAGTTAELWLPRAQARPARSAAAPRRAVPQVPRSCSVLLVDDDALISMATCEMLKDLGHRVVEAPSGSRALEILHAGTPVDLVVSDEAMPNMGVRSWPPRSVPHGPICRSSWPPATPSCRRAASWSCRCCASPIRSRISPPRSSGRSAPRPRQRLERRGASASARRPRPGGRRTNDPDPC